MKSSLSLPVVPLLAISFLAVACMDDEQAAPLQPPAPSADVVIESQPETGDFLVTELLYQTTFGQPCTQPASQNSPTEWQVANSGVPCSITVRAQFGNEDPAQKGSVTFWFCDLKGAGQAPRSLAQCQAKDDAEWELQARNVAVNNNGEVTRLPSPYAVTAGSPGQGLKIKYTAKGSGIRNHEIELNIIPGLVP